MFAMNNMNHLNYELFKLMHDINNDVTIPSWIVYPLSYIGCASDGTCNIKIKYLLPYLVDA